MTREEMIKYEIDYFINLMRIKKAENGTNTELDYQIKVQRCVFRLNGTASPR